MNSDYIIRVIEQFVQTILAIVKARKAGNYEEAFHQIQKASRRYLDADISLFLSKTPEQLLGHFKGNRQDFDTEECILCADLLYETALICEDKNCEGLSLRSKILCLNLYLNAIPKERQFQTQPYMERVNELIKGLETVIIPVSVKESILNYRKSLN